MFAAKDCLLIENQETVILRAPKESAAMKNSEKGIGQCAHRFIFTRVRLPAIEGKMYLRRCYTVHSDSECSLRSRSTGIYLRQKQNVTINA